MHQQGAAPTRNLGLGFRSSSSPTCEHTNFFTLFETQEPPCLHHGNNSITSVSSSHTSLTLLTHTNKVQRLNKSWAKPSHRSVTPTPITNLHIRDNTRRSRVNHTPHSTQQAQVVPSLPMTIVTVSNPSTSLFLFQINKALTHYNLNYTICKTT